MYLMPLLMHKLIPLMHLMPFCLVAFNTFLFGCFEWLLVWLHSMHLVTFFKTCKHSAKVVVLNLVRGTEPHKLLTCIHGTLSGWKNKICVVNFILFILTTQKSLAAEPLKLTHRTPGIRSNLVKNL